MTISKERLTTGEGKYISVPIDGAIEFMEMIIKITGVPLEDWTHCLGDEHHCVNCGWLEVTTLKICGGFNLKFFMGSGQFSINCGRSFITDKEGLLEWLDICISRPERLYKEQPRIVEEKRYPHRKHQLSSMAKTVIQSF